IGYGISTDNHHLTQPNPDGSGPRRAMEQALAQAELEPNQVGYINAHGTATILNDTAEGKAIMELFGDVPVSSTKSMMGHSLGAAGALEAAATLLALEHQFLPPHIDFAVRCRSRIHRAPSVQEAVASHSGCARFRNFQRRRHLYTTFLCRRRELRFAIGQPAAVSRNRLQRSRQSSRSDPGSHWRFLHGCGRRRSRNFCPEDGGGFDPIG